MGDKYSIVIQSLIEMVEPSVSVYNMLDDLIKRNSIYKPFIFLIISKDGVVVQFAHLVSSAPSMLNIYIKKQLN
jgi:hypothetical protein